MKAKFEKGHYGPYSHDLMHLLIYLNGHYIKFKSEETKPTTTVYLVEEKLPEVEAFCNAHLSSEQKERLDRILELIEGFESPYGLELLATVDFIRTKSPSLTVSEIQEQIHSWTSRKRELMKPHHIQVAFDRLTQTFS